MNIVLIGNFPTSITIYSYLSEQNYLKAVCFQEHKNPQVNQEFWKNSIEKEGYKTFTINKDNLKNQFIEWLQNESPDLVLVCGFSLKIPKEALQIPLYGFLNIHFGKLPENRGPDPLFWSIKNGENQTAITLHQIDEDWDTGKVLLTHQVSILPGETLGMLNSKMSYLLKEAIQKALPLINNSENYISQSSKQNHNYNKRPTTKETTIDWENQTADQIENLVNACNPKYKGATTYYQGSPIQIVEVSPVDSHVPLLGKTAGEIVHAHPQEGLFVSCKYGKLIKINIISSDAGELSGTKYIHLGLRQGHRFTTKLTSTKMVNA